METVSNLKKIAQELSKYSGKQYEFSDDIKDQAKIF